MISIGVRISARDDRRGWGNSGLAPSSSLFVRGNSGPAPSSSLLSGGTQGPHQVHLFCQPELRASTDLRTASYGEELRILPQQTGC